MNTKKRELICFLFSISLLSGASFQVEKEVYVLNGSRVMLPCNLGNELDLNISWNMPNGDSLCADENLKNSSDNVQHLFVSTQNRSAGFTSELTVYDITHTDAGTYTCTSFPDKATSQYHVIVVDPPPAPYQCHILQEGPIKEILCATEYIDLKQFTFVLRLARAGEKKILVASAKRPRFQLNFQNLITNGSLKNVSLVLCVVHVNLSTALSCGQPVYIGQVPEHSDSSDQTTKLYIALSASTCLGIILIALGIGLAVFCHRRRGSLKTGILNTSTSHAVVEPATNTLSTCNSLENSTDRPTLPEEHNLNWGEENSLTNYQSTGRTHLTLETDFYSFPRQHTGMSITPLASKQPSLEQSTLSAYDSAQQKRSAPCSLTDDQKRQSLELMRLREQHLRDIPYTRDSVKLENSPILSRPAEQDEAGITNKNDQHKGIASGLHDYKFPKSSDGTLPLEQHEAGKTEILSPQYDYKFPKSCNVTYSTEQVEAVLCNINDQRKNTASAPHAYKFPKPSVATYPFEPGEAGLFNKNDQGKEITSKLHDYKLPKSSKVTHLLKPVEASISNINDQCKETPSIPQDYKLPKYSNVTYPLEPVEEVLANINDQRKDIPSTPHDYKLLKFSDVTLPVKPADENNDQREEISSALQNYKFPKSSDLKTETFPRRIKTRPKETHSRPCCDDVITGTKPSLRNDYECLYMHHIHTSPHFPNFHVCPRHFRRKLDATDRSQSTFSLQFVHRLDHKMNSDPDTETNDVWQELPPDLKVMPPDLDLPPKLSRKTKTRSSFLLSDLPDHAAAKADYAVPRITSPSTRRLLAQQGPDRSQYLRTRKEANVHKDDSFKTKDRSQTETIQVVKKPKINFHVAGGASATDFNRDNQMAVGKNASNSSLQSMPTNARSRRRRSKSLNIPGEQDVFKRYWNKGELLRPWHRSSTKHYS